MIIIKNQLVIKMTVVLTLCYIVVEIVITVYCSCVARK